MVALPGVTDTGLAAEEPPGARVIVAVADLVESAWLVAVRFMVCNAVILEGAVYTPDESTLPIPAGLIDQLTRLLLEFATFAVNCSVIPCVSVALAGLTVIDIGGNRVTCTLAVRLGVPRVDAVNAIVCCASIAVGAV
jgi:hypothetical protein